MVDLLALGPLELWHKGQQYDLGSAKERAVLAILVHARGEPVTLGALMVRLWDDAPPRAATETLHSYLSRLRAHLRATEGAVRLDRPSPGRYQLRTDPGDVDLVRFQRLRAEAAEAAGRGDRELAVGKLRTAEALWRGEPCTELAGAWAASTRARLAEDHRRVKEERIRFELELGRHADLLGELHEMVGQNPLAQQAVATLMLALYRSGRNGEALALYRTTHRRLDAELGIEPGAELRDLHHRILEQAPSLEAPDDDRGAVALRDPQAPAPGPPRCNLPRDVRDFTGRTGELRALLADTGTDETVLPVTVVHGMPGVGKTALAVRAAYQLRSRYPDGQLYVDLRAYSGQPRYAPAEALEVLLHAAGLAEELPESLGGRAARWREWTARHRVLVVLDNARDAAQVRPLLPGAPHCRALVTSRNRLAGLEGAASLFLDVLTEREGAALFARIAGAARARDTRDTGALHEAVRVCGCHPLTIQLLASRFRHRDTWDLPYLLDRLAEESGPLGALDGGVAAAFQLSYAELPEPARRLFRRLALHPGPDLTLDAAVALAGDDPAGVRRTVEELLDCHLLEEPVRDRYQLHDLARAFGRRACAEEETATARRAALHRVLAWYCAMADRADRLTRPWRRRRAVPEVPCSGGTGPKARLQHPDAAEVWLAVERTNLLALARAAVTEAPAYAALFPHVLAQTLKTWGTWNVAAELHEAAVGALRGADGTAADPAELAGALVELADVMTHKRPDRARSSAVEALRISEARGDPHGCADALFQWGRARLTAGSTTEALRLLERSLTLYRREGDKFGEAEVLNVRGVALYTSGHSAEAVASLRAALDINLEIGHVRGQVWGQNNLGEVHRIEGRYEEARACYERSLELVRRIGGRQELANLCNNLGALCEADGDIPQALAYFERALSSYRTGHDARGESDTLVSLGTAYAASGRNRAALEAFTAAERIAGETGNRHERQCAMVGRGRALRNLGRYDAAAQAFREALLLAREIETPLGAAQALDGLARTVLTTQGAAAARKFAEDAMGLYEQVGVVGEARALRRQMGLLKEVGS